MRDRAPAVRRRVRWVRWVLVGIVAVVAVAVAVVAAATYSVIWTARQDDRGRTDLIVVLGASQYWGDPSPVFANRLEHAAELYAAGVAGRIVTVGGKQEGDVTTEAQAGRSYLVGHGVPAAAVEAIATGRDTWESVQALAARMADRGWRSATIVSDPAHVARAAAMASALGIEARTSPTQSGAGSATTADYVLRETAGLLGFWLVQRWSVDPVVGGS
ncbi:MAG: YdcF family protein [Actinomycetota bacterium]|nr:MAG: YdcF family protein [Actinomycetota bacterium]